MNKWHKRLMYLQIILLVSMCFLKFYSNGVSLVGLVLFTLLEFGVLEKQRTENKEAVLYSKSCFFALFDVLSVLIFLCYFAIVFCMVFTGFQTSLTKYLPILFIYILVRKFYITKNYSYEK